MQRGTRFVPLTIVTLAVLCGWLCAAPVAAQIADEAKAKIDIALPAAPIAEPQRERKLLVFSLSNGFQHSAIPYGDYTFARMGEKSGAFTATISTDPQAFAPASLAEYDAILFNNTTGTLFTDPVLRESLINFVHGGGGIVGIHAATDCFYDWPQFGELMGGYFDGHPWNEAVTLKIDEPDHPVAQPLGEEFTVADEIYQFKQPYSRENLRVLASLDTTKTDMSKKGIARDDGDFAVSWVRDYGQGRIFYCSLGHRHEIFWNEAVLRHYLAGIQFALGDLQAEAEPSRTGAAIEGDLAQAFAEAAEYEFGDSRLPLTAIENAVFAAVDSPAERRSLEARLIDLLKDEVSYDVQAFVCRELSLVGGEASAEAVAPLLVDERLSHMARYTLERLDTPAADEVLRNALERLDGQLRIGVINSLGQRGRRGAVAPLLALAQDSETDDATRAAVAEAIGRLGGMEGNDALVNLANLGRQTQSGELLEACYLAMAQCAESLVEEGNLEQAAKIYTRLHNPTMAEKHRLAGLRGLAMTEPLKTIPTLIKNINGEDGVMRQTSLRLIQEIGDGTVTRIIAIQLADLPFRSQAALIDALAERGDRGALRVIGKRVDAGNPGVKKAAIRALGALGDADTVPLLVQLIEQGSPEARASLEGLRGEEIDAAIVAALDSADASGRADLVRILGTRRATGSLDELIDLAANDASTEVRLAAYDVIATLGAAEQAGPCLDLLLAASVDAEARAAGDALIACCERGGEPETCAVSVAAALTTAQPPARGEVLRVLSALGGNAALEAVRGFYAVSDGPAADAGLRALANWRDASSAEELLSIVTSGREHHRALAFEGYINVVSLPNERPASESVRLLQRLLVHAKSPQQTARVLAALAEVPHPAVFDVAERYLADATLRTAATETILAVATAIGPEHERRALASVEQAMEHAPANEALRRRIGQTVDAIQRQRNFITTFVYAGPYTRPQAGAEAVFDTAFPPESEGFTGWREVPADAIAAPGRIDLNKIEPASNCAGYLYAQIVSPRRQQARLQFGSDDGIKVWLNGDVVHSNMAFRGLTLNEDSAIVTLQPGTNHLLLKIVQGSGGWEAACRLRSPEGFELMDVTVRRPGND